MSGAIESTFSFENCFSPGIGIEFVTMTSWIAASSGSCTALPESTGWVAPTKIGPAPIAASALAPAGDLRYSIDLLIVAAEDLGGAPAEASDGIALR